MNKIKQNFTKLLVKEKILFNLENLVHNKKEQNFTKLPKLFFVLATIFHLIRETEGSWNLLEQPQATGTTGTPRCGYSRTCVRW